MKNPKILIGSLLILLLIIIFELRTRYVEAVEENNLLHMSLEGAQSGLKIQKNKLKTERKLIKDLSRKNKDLAAQVLHLKKIKEKIKYVNVTKYKTETVTKIVKELPDSFIFYTKYDMPICMYEKIEESYKFEVLPVEYTANVVIAENSNLVDIKAKSLYNNKEYKIPVEITSTVKVKEKTDKIFQPKLSLGLAIDSQIKANSSLGVSLFQYKKFNFLKANILINENPKIGISPVSYNFSNSIPLIQNTSLEIGISTDLLSNSLYLGISTEL